VIAIETLETRSLGDRSYLATDGTVAVVIDPQRDIDRVLAVADRRGVRITHVAETHLHNDYVSGGLELAARTGAAYLVPADAPVEYDRQPVTDGDLVEIGAMRLRAVHTPGHTHHHLSYVLEDADGTVHGAFTGGSMLYGATGRTDLVGPEHTDELTHAQFHSVRRLARELPGPTEILPTHGFGSFCSATQTDSDASTIDAQRDVNPALTLEEQEYVDTLISGLGAYPAYYAHMGPLNAGGPALVDLSLPEEVDGATLRQRIAAGEWVVDLRERTAFAAGHLAGSLGFELSQSFVTYLGWLYRYGTPLTLLGESREQVAQARRELVRIGVDDLAGMAVGDVDALAAGAGLSSYGVADFADLAAALEGGPVQVLDIRRDEERAAGHVRGSQHIPLHELPARQDEVPDGAVWIHCGSGYRAAVAASMLDRPGREVVLVSDAYERVADLGLETAASPRS
jgi:hydroxyacylglutathione hydrolase